VNVPSSHPVETVRHSCPPLRLLAAVFTVLFLAGLYPVTVFAGRPFFPGPYESAWIVAVGFLLPNTISRAASPALERPA
jgi:hypothetical protein